MASILRAVNGQYQNVAQASPSPSAQAGTLYEDGFGRVWGYFQASAALSAGNVCRLINNHGVVRDADVDAVAEADTIRVNGTGDFTTTLMISANDGSTNANEDGLGHQYFLFIDAGASQNQGGPVRVRVDDNNIDVYWETSSDGKIATALTTSSDFILYTLSRVELTTDPDDIAVCVPQIAVTDEYWFWGLMYGHGYVLLDTSDSAITDDDRIVIPSATTDGYAEGATGTITAAEVASAFGRAIFDCTQDGLVPVLINTLWAHPMAFTGVPSGAAKAKAFPNRT